MGMGWVSICRADEEMRWRQGGGGGGGGQGWSGNCKADEGSGNRCVNGWGSQVKWKGGED